MLFSLDWADPRPAEGTFGQNLVCKKGSQGGNPEGSSFPDSVMSDKWLRLPKFNLLIS